MLKLLSALVLFIGILSSAHAYEPYPNMTGNRAEDKKLINNAIKEANHCSSDDDCGTITFNCKTQYYNNNESKVSELNYKYKTYKYDKPEKEKCLANAAARKSLCREGKCVPAS